MPDRVVVGPKADRPGLPKQTPVLVSLRGSWVELLAWGLVVVARDKVCY